jgi:cell division protease FtsH
MDEIDEATDRVLMGPAKTSRQITDREKKLVSLHEAGHAVIGIKLEDAADVHKITIIPRGMAGGYTMMMPKEEKMNLSTKNELLAQITGLLGGRVSEELFFGEISTGASDDFSKATKIARAMVTEYGMSDLGPVQLEEKQGNVFLGRDYDKAKNFSDTVALEIDTEVRKIMDSCYKEATKILKENKKLVTLISDILIEHETITKEEIDELVETGKIAKYEEEKNESKKKDTSKKEEETTK